MSRTVNLCYDLNRELATLPILLLFVYIAVIIVIIANFMIVAIVQYVWYYCVIMLQLM